MKDVHIVIDANYGDEDKGATTALLATKINECYSNNDNKFVILPHGGMNREHSAYVNGEWKFYHALCSASHLGWHTVYGENFIFNPYIFKNEVFFDMPKAYIHGNCKFSTLFDMVLNHFEVKHGKSNNTLDEGIRETIKRYQSNWMSFGGNSVNKSVNDFFYSGSGGKSELMFNIGHYFDDECKKRGYDIVGTKWEEFLSVFNKAYDDWTYREFGIHFTHKPYTNYRNFFVDTTPIIFECSYGLMLDETYNGVYEPMRIMYWYKKYIRNINVYYITRPYLNDESINNMLNRIDNDYSKLSGKYTNVYKHLVITHADEECSDNLINAAKKNFDNVIIFGMDDIINNYKNVAIS